MSFTPTAALSVTDLRDTLGRDRDQVAANFRGRWSDAGASFEMPVVLHGTGQLGRESLRLFRKATGGEPVAFTDNDPELWKTSLDGIKVMDPAAAVEQWGKSGVFVAALYNPSGVIAQLRRVGASLVVPWHWMFAANPETFLPYWGFDVPDRILENPEQVLQAAEVWADEESQRIYLEQIRWLLTLESDALSPSLDVKDAYFDRDFITLSSEESFVDCGAFDGDSFSIFLQRTSGQFGSAYLIEPDPDNYENLARWSEALPPEKRTRITLHNCALGREEGVARFAATGGVDSSLDAQGEIEVRVSPLDSLVPVSEVTFLKVDVEGGEIDLLKGSSAILGEGRSTWAVMGYHRPTHLWDIPLELAKYDGRDLYLRRYAEDCWERCIYAVARS
jgi:FkbM family methyltransferase